MLRRAKNYSDKFLLSTGAHARSGVRAHAKTSRPDTGARLPPRTQPCRMFALQTYRRLNARKPERMSDFTRTRSRVRKASIYAGSSTINAKLDARVVALAEAARLSDAENRCALFCRRARRPRNRKIRAHRSSAPQKNFFRWTRKSRARSAICAKLRKIPLVIATRDGM